MLFEIASLVLMAAFYACYILKMISQKRQGISTDQLGKGKGGFEKFVEIALKIATYTILPVQVVSVFLFDNTVHTALRIAGVVITASGVSVFIASVLQMKDNWRAGVQREEKTNLVTEGIYSISRNPAFLGFDLMYIGILCAFFNYYLFAVTIIAMILFHLQIVKVEEKFLVEAFGDDYLSYKKRVGRYLGRKFSKTLDKI